MRYWAFARRSRWSRDQGRASCAGVGDEGGEAGGVFTAGGGLYAACYIDSPGVELVDCLGNVVWSQAAGDDDAQLRLSYEDAARFGPVERDASATGGRRRVWNLSGRGRSMRRDATSARCRVTPLALSVVSPMAQWMVWMIDMPGPRRAARRVAKSRLWPP